MTAAELERTELVAGQVPLPGMPAEGVLFHVEPPEGLAVGPRRVQLRRTRGWRKPAGSVVVARPSRWGNPWVVHQHGAGCADRCPEWSQPTPAAAVLAFRHAVLFPLIGQPTVPDPDTIRVELAGRDLACWCPPGQPCHADVLLALANAGAGA